MLPSPTSFNPPHPIELAEWERLDGNQHSLLADRHVADTVLADPLVEKLRDRLSIVRTQRGLEISSTSFVGRVDVGQLRVTIKPKLPTLPLACLLRYAYGLRDLQTIEETQVPTTPDALHDLLIAMLVTEVEELLHRGPARQYVLISRKLESPRGRILVEALARQGGIREARLPCRYFERHINWHLNQVLRAGLDLAARMTNDREQRRHLYRLSYEFEQVEQSNEIRGEDIDKAERDLTRLTNAYGGAISIIRLLYQMQGVTFESETRPHRIPGFLFDMNLFFQRLLSRFLRENLVGKHISDQWSVRSLFSYAAHANPKRRTAPMLRPDYALFQGNVLQAFLDAKYRDLWEKQLPPEWLYQLSVYALASQALRLSVILYPSMNEGASDQQINIRTPFDGLTGVVVRPVPLSKLAELVQPRRQAEFAAERQRMAARLVLLEIRAPKHTGLHAA
jgi:5-methylcytosine-specific restriction enzyme subunit McrC